MDKTKARILWIDSTPDTTMGSPNLKSELKPYIRLLEFHGFDVSCAEGNDDGIDLLKSNKFHALILSADIQNFEQLSRIRCVDPHIPIILLTNAAKQEIMAEASLHNIHDVLIMPTNPRQLVTSITLLLEKQRMRETYVPQAYVNMFNRQHVMNDTEIVDRPDQFNEYDWQVWVEAYVQFVEWDMKFDGLSNVDELKTIHAREKRDANTNFSNYIQNTYSQWLDGENSPTLSVDVFYKYVIPEIQVGKSVLFVVMDCMRLDHWMKIEPILYPDFQITKHYYYSIIPTTTHYSRNALFSGLFPRDLAERYPELYAEPDNEHTSINRFEKELMSLQLDRHGIVLKPTPHYYKIFDARGETQYLQWLDETKRISLAAVVVDFLDMLIHLRSEVDLFQQLVSSEEAFRSLVQAWFRSSQLYKIITLAAERGMTIVITSDHGSVLCQNAAKISSRHELSSGLRIKEGKDISCPPEAGFLIDDPELYKLPGNDAEKNYMIAKEDYFFVYENQYNTYRDIFQGSFQHGGISLEEIILPCVVLEPR